MVLIYYQRYLDYIRLSGGKPSITWFDEDWEPIGPIVREEMVAQGLISEVDGHLQIKEQS